jgi:NTP pyrophosphatase (non-canonical NTP hydrolase)
MSDCKRVFKIDVGNVAVEDLHGFLEGVKARLKVTESGDVEVSPYRAPAQEIEVAVSTPQDRLDSMFEKQHEFMDMLREHDVLPEFPVDLTTKPGQRLIRETLLNMIEELMEASFELRNKVHKITDDRVLNLPHYKEELGDAFAYFIEACILSGFSASDLYEEYSRKNLIVKKRVESGY